MSRVLVLKGATIIDGTGAKPIANGLVVIENQRVVRVGLATEQEAQLPSGHRVETLELDGKYVLPGLVNAHSHLDGHRMPDMYQDRSGLLPEALILRMVRNAILDIVLGVTTVREMGAAHWVSIVFREAVRSGTVLGPRIYTCGMPLAMTGGHAHQFCVECDGADEVRKGARLQLKKGADFVKCMASGSFSAVLARPGHSEMTVAELQAAFEEAHNAGKLTTAHAHTPKTIQNAVEAGVDCIEHGFFINEETAELLADKGIVLVPTLAVSWVTAHRGLSYNRTARYVEEAKANLDVLMGNYRRAVKAGVKMVVGTDELSEVHEEMARMVEGGLSPMDVIVAATRHGAELCQIADNLGTIEPGKLADLVVVNRDPLEDINNVASVYLVVVGGRLFWPEVLRASLPVSVHGTSVNWAEADSEPSMHEIKNSGPSLIAGLSS